MNAAWRKRIPATIFAAAVMALTAGGLAQPAVSHAEKVWDIGVYDQCIKDNGTIHAHFCCANSGGEWDYDNGKCTAPVAAQVDPVKPGSLGVPGTIHTRPGQAKLP